MWEGERSRHKADGLDTSALAGSLQPRTGDDGADKSLTTALSRKAVVAHQTKIAALANKYLLVQSEALPPECAWSPSLVRGPNWEHDESIVVLTFTRPALANGYAFIEEYEGCPGMCGTTFLRVFRKEHGRWTQVGRTILSVS